MTISDGENGRMNDFLMKRIGLALMIVGTILIALFFVVKASILYNIFVFAIWIGAAYMYVYAEGKNMKGKYAIVLFLGIEISGISAFVLIVKSILNLVSQYI